MKKNNFILALVLLFGCTHKFGLKKNQEELKLSDNVIPVHYELTLYTQDEDFSGQVAIDLELKKDADSIFIHGQDLKIASLDLIKEDKIYKGQAQKVDDDGLLKIIFDKKIPKGNYQLQISYSGKYQNDLSGLYKVKDGGYSYLFTQFEPMDARKMLPC